MSDEEIGKIFDWWLEVVPDTLTAVFVMSSVHFKEKTLRNACDAVGFSYDRREAALRSSDARSAAAATMLAAR